MIRSWTRTGPVDCISRRHKFRANSRQSNPHKSLSFSFFQTQTNSCFVQNQKNRFPMSLRILVLLSTWPSASSNVAFVFSSCSRCRFRLPKISVPISSVSRAMRWLSSSRLFEESRRAVECNSLSLCNLASTAGSDADVFVVAVYVNAES
jgi:hypothetical protein